MKFKDVAPGTWFSTTDGKRYLKIQASLSNAPYNARCKEILCKFPDDAEVTILDHQKRES
jgi:hypothetical protein